MDIEKPTRFRYDNCIVRERSDTEYSSSEASFSLGLNGYNSSGTQTTYQSNSSSDEDDDSNVPPLKLGSHDCYVLIVGFLRRIEAYLNNSTFQDEEKQKLLKYSVLIREALMANCQEFSFSDKANQTTVASISHNAIDNPEKASVSTRFSVFKNVKDTSTPLPRTKTGRTRFSHRLQNLANLKKDSQITVTSVLQNGTAGNDFINDIEETDAGTARRSSLKRAKKISTPLPKAPVEETATARRSSFKKAKKTSTPIPKTSKIEENRSSRRLQNLNTFKMSDDTANNNEQKDVISRKRSASSLNYQPVSVKRAKYIEFDRMARIQSKLQETINSFRKSSASSDSEATNEFSRKATKANEKSKKSNTLNSFRKTSASSESETTSEFSRKAMKAKSKSKKTDTVKSFWKTSESSESEATKEPPRKATKARKGANNQVQHNGEVKRLNSTGRNNVLSKSLYTVNSGKNLRQLSGEGTSGTINKSLPNGLNIAHRKSPQRGKKSTEKATKSKDLGTVNTKKNQRQLSGEAPNGTRNKGLSKSLNIADKKSSKKEKGLKMKSATSNIKVGTTSEMNKSQSDSTGGTLNTSRVPMKRKLYSAESWLQTLSETMP